MAAVLACGYGAVLSHGAAAALWGFLRPTEGPIDVSIPTRAGRRRRAGISVHRCATLARETSLALSYGETGRKRHGVVVMVRRGVPVTSPQRTIDDLRGAVAPYLERRARRQAELAGWRLEGAENDGARSDLEDEFVALCRRHQLPRPELGVQLGKWTVDFLWRARRLVVETDGFAYHRGSVSFEDDHARDLDLRGRGFTVHRFTGRQLREEPERVIADLRAALSSGDRR
jgi:very-short-patch-repair endonuclease